MSSKAQDRPDETTMDKALNVLVKIYNDSLDICGYDYIIRKRVLRRLWGVIGAHLKNLEEAF